jgi:hypothetical protein
MHVSNEWEILITKRINYCVSKFIQLIQVTQTYLILQLTNNFALLLIFSPKIYFFLNLNLKQFRQIFFCWWPVDGFTLGFAVPRCVSRS